MGMRIQEVPFSTIDWNAMPPKAVPGSAGEAYIRSFEVGNLRVRMVEYSPGYSADHRCSKGHVALVLDGELTMQLKDGRTLIMKPGCSFQAGEDMELYRSDTQVGAVLFIVDQSCSEED
jgi:hypothetical protein